MEITRRQLRKIIIEEKRKIIIDSNQEILREGFIGDIWQKAKSMVGVGEDEDINKVVNNVESNLPQMPDIENAKWADVKKIIEAVSGPGTDEKAVGEVIEKRANDLPALSKEFDDFIKILKDIRAQMPKTAGDVLKSAAKGAIIGAAILGGLVALASIAVPAGVVSSAAATKGVVGTLVVTGGQSTAAATTAALSMPALTATGMPAAAMATGASKAFAASALGKAMGAKATTTLASGAFMPLAAKMATIGGVAGAKAGASIEGIDKILGWADTFLNKDTTLSLYLKDDGLDTYAMEIDAKLEDKAFSKPTGVKESKVKSKSIRITEVKLRKLIRKHIQYSI